ncbi:hypothetical protein BFJ72_g13561 [Fusarium proliferatum]|uniref:Uncharacterized protein n=1 Tax=Gibberella intermedia TaxID=948311 RepID=A0A420SBY4_GIBIN|nr:hypothetical protein BFJ72_g13561 [Fusarium proliferatum]
MVDPATITPAEWESLKHDETATEIESINPASSLLSLCTSAFALYDETGSPDLEGTPQGFTNCKMLFEAMCPSG